MKNYEKLYKEALERAKKLKETCDSAAVIGWCEYIFPELKESSGDDNAYFEFTKAAIEYFYDENNPLRKVLIAWLEKQGVKSQDKPVNNTDNVEPKFRVGDVVVVKPMALDGMVIEGTPFKIANITENGYISDDGRFFSISLQGGWNLVKQKSSDKVASKFKAGDWVVTSSGKVNQVIAVDEDGDGFTLDDGTYFSGSWKDMYDFWTIEDAKAGDIIATPNQNIFVFLKIYDATVYDYCGVYFGKFQDESAAVNGTMATELPSDFAPATKEQRAYLFAKMFEAGYGWDAEKKELVKLYEPDPVYKGLFNQSNGIWHTVDEVPDKYEKVLVEWKWPNDAEILHECVISPFRYDFEGKTILRWAYIEDLIK